MRLAPNDLMISYKASPSKISTIFQECHSGDQAFTKWNFRDIQQNMQTTALLILHLYRLEPDEFEEGSNVV